MADGTGISWTDATWNPIRGCRRTAPDGSKQSGCGDPSGGGCYAERMAYRFSGPGQAYDGLVKLTANGPRWTGETRFVSEHLMDPFRWTKPRRIFTDSMSDLFFKGISDWEIDSVVAVMMICCLHETRGGHTFQTLTKRPARMRAYLSDPATLERVARRAATLMEDGDGWFDTIAFRPEGLVHPNMWWGVSVENQEAADERIPELLRTPAAVRFLSCEPLLGPVNLDAIQIPGERAGLRFGSLRHLESRFGEAPALIDQVIAGCESGPGARPCDIAWLRSLRDQCAAAGVSYFLKQAEESADLGSDGRLDIGDDDSIAFGDGSKLKRRRPGGHHVIELPYLDGVQHAAFPEVRDV